VRGWLTRFAVLAESVRSGATGLIGSLVGDPPVLEPAGSVLADALRAVLVAAAMIIERFGVSLAVSVWEVVAAFTSGRLLAPAGASWSINTSWP
jgi:hypothetical protein